MLLIENIFQQFKNKTRLNIRWKMVGDMYKRMDFIVDRFSGLDSIVEFGPYEGCSTAAWIMARPKKFTTVDQGIKLNIEEYHAAAKEVGVDFKFILGNDLNIDIEPADLLFIDTMHTAEHTYNELNKHAKKIKRYLAFHDVNPERFGTIEGIKRWWANNADWKAAYQDFNDCGFMILERK